MPTETVAAAKWLYSVLSGDSALSALVGARVFAYRVPEGTAFPCGIFQLQAAQPDSRVIGDIRLTSRIVWVVKAIGQGADFVSIQPVAERIDELLEASSGSNVDGVIVSCVRDRPLEMLEASDTGEDYAHLGGLYRFTVIGT